MLKNIKTFNEDISAWDSSRIATFQFMFRGAAAFDQELSSWDTSRVEGMSFMFEDASSFNSDISSWDVTKVLSGTWGMFKGASAFNQSLCSWGAKLRKNTDVRDMFTDTACPNKADPVLGASPPGPFCHECS
jgi:surface protein